MRNGKWMVAGAGLALAVVIGASPGADEPVTAPKAIQEAVNKMADTAAKGKRFDKDADAFFREHPGELRQMMAVFGPRDKGGLGVGPKPGAYPLDSIELLINDQTSKAPKTKLDLKKSADDLNRLADVTLAVAGITYRYVPKSSAAEDERDWLRRTDRMKEAAQNLKAAVKEEDADRVRVAFQLLGASCARCHEKFHPGRAVVPKEKPAPKNEKIIVPKTIRDTVSKMADDVGKGEKVDKRAAALFMLHGCELRKTMWVFKPRESDGVGGFGVGPKPGVYRYDGIEAYLAFKSSSRGKVTAAELKDGAADLNRLADVTIAMAAITRQYALEDAVPGVKPKIWTQYSDEMKKGAEDLKAAVKGQKPDEAKKAFQAIYSACANCHTEFRE